MKILLATFISVFSLSCLAEGHFEQSASCFSIQNESEVYEISLPASVAEGQADIHIGMKVQIKMNDGSVNKGTISQLKLGRVSKYKMTFQNDKGLSFDGLETDDKVVFSLKSGSKVIKLMCSNSPLVFLNY